MRRHFTTIKKTPGAVGVERLGLLGALVAHEVVGIVVAADGLDLVLRVPATPGVAVQEVEHDLVVVFHADEAVDVLGRELRRTAHHVVDLLDERHVGHRGRSARRVNAERCGLVLLAHNDLAQLLAHVLGDGDDERGMDDLAPAREEQCSAEVREGRHTHEDGEISHEVLTTAHERATSEIIQRTTARPKGLGGLELIHERAVFRAQLRPFHEFTFQSSSMEKPNGLTRRYA